MIPAEIIKIKRGKGELSPEQIKAFVAGYVIGSVADYQMSALLMAIFLNGMTKKETLALTEAMLHSGEVVDLSGIAGRKIDKHSTGGVGDKTSLIIGPIAAAAGVKVPMISGRGLGHTGGTLDKLESIPGFSTQLNLEQFKKQIASLGICYIGQTKEICPADKKMYALRDVTGTVECVPLICASIMSKKLAEGIDGLVLDVKVGSGAFMKNIKEARVLAQGLVGIAKGAKKKVVALITDMNQPLGAAIGNSLEVQECLDVFNGGGPKDLRDLSIELAAAMIWLGGKAKDMKAARKLASEILDDGRAKTIFEKLVETQGGDLSKLPRANQSRDVLAKRNGFVTSMNVEKLGIASLMLGAGRTKADDQLDLSAGIVMHKRLGQKVKEDESIATIYYNNSTVGLRIDDVCEVIVNAVVISLQKKAIPRLITEVMRGK